MKDGVKLFEQLCFVDVVVSLDICSTCVTYYLLSFCCSVDTDETASVEASIAKLQKQQKNLREGNVT